MPGLRSCHDGLRGARDLRLTGERGRIDGAVHAQPPFRTSRKRRQVAYSAVSAFCQDSSLPEVPNLREALPMTGFAALAARPRGAGVGILDSQATWQAERGPPHRESGTRRPHTYRTRVALARLLPMPRSSLVSMRSLAQPAGRVLGIATASARLLWPWTACSRNGLIALGFSSAGAAQAIAARLVISLPTVKRHISNGHGRWAVKSQTQAVSMAREQGLIE
jgi:DNA-binding CsgD family transcriptional regulator